MFSLQAHLWFPETSNELKFVSSTFQVGVSGVFHLGIKQYSFNEGIVYSDNSIGDILQYDTDITGDASMEDHLRVFTVSLGEGKSVLPSKPFD